MSLSDRDKKILIAIVPLLVLGAYWFLLLAPKREEASTAAAAQTKAADRLELAKKASADAQTAEVDFSDDYAEIVRLGKAIPAEVDMPSLLVQLNAAAAGTGIQFTRITTGERLPAGGAAAPAPQAGGSSNGSTGSNGSTPAAAGGAPAQSAPGQAAESANNAAATAGSRNAAAEQSGVNPTDTQTSTPSGNGLPVGGGATAPAGTEAAPATGPTGVETVSLELEFVGDFFNLADFFHRTKRFVQVAGRQVLVNGRLITFEGVSFASDTQIFPRIRAELAATVYLSPKAQGPTAGATPQGPAPAAPGTTPASTPAATPTAPAAPTAVATP